MVKRLHAPIATTYILWATVKTKLPTNIVLERCTLAGDYRAERFPTCGCKTCWTVWMAKAQMPREEFLTFLLDTSLAWNKFAESAHQ